MGVVEGLWESGVLGGIFTSAITFLGQLSALNSQKFAAVVDILKSSQSGDTTTHDAAFARSGDAGAAVRRFMLFMGFFMLGICPLIFAFFPEVPVAVETASQSGGWLWGIIPEKEQFAVAYVNGFYLSEIWKDLMANLISAYIGAGITRKAFQLGR